MCQHLFEYIYEMIVNLLNQIDADHYVQPPNPICGTRTHSVHCCLRMVNGRGRQM